MGFFLKNENTSMKKIFLALLVLALAAGLTYTLMGTPPPAPLGSLTSIAGQKTTMDALKGKVVLVNFWATSCPGCIKEMPMLVDMHKKFSPQGYETVAVAMSYDPPAFVREYVAANRLPFFVTLDTQGELAKAFGDVRLTPTSVLVDKKGMILKRFLGEPDASELSRLISEALTA